MPVFKRESPLPDFELNSRPAVKNGGIWTWGHVIYDYRSFIDNMVMLKLNTVTIWNDFLPKNARKKWIDAADRYEISLF